MARTFALSTDKVRATVSNPIAAAPLTLACWCYPTADALQGMFGYFNVAGGEGMALVQRLTSKHAAFLTQALSTPNYVETSAAMTLNAWNHVCAVFTSTGASGIAIFLNGAGKTTGTGQNPWQFATPTAFDAGGPTQVMLGSGHFLGRVAECAAWNVALTDAEVVALAQGVSPQQIRRTALKLHWPLWAVASPEADLSGSGFGGTVTGATLADHAPVGMLVPGHAPAMPRGASSVTVTEDVTTDAAVSTTHTADVTTTAAATTPDSADVTTTAATTAPAHTDATTTADVSVAEQANATTDAAISIAHSADATTSGAVSATQTADATTTAATLAPAHTDVTTSAAVTVIVHSSVDLSTAASVTVTKDVATSAAVRATVTRDVTTDAAVDVARLSLATSAAVSRNPSLDVGTSAAVSRAAGAVRSFAVIIG